jgi:LPS-assembly protein
MTRTALRHSLGGMAILLWTMTAAPQAQAQAQFEIDTEPPPGLTEFEVQTDLPIALVADEIIYESEIGRVTATGNVEVYHGERTLTADKIVYDDRTGRISAEGDLVLRDPAGVTVYADAADLDAELRDALVIGARSVIAENVRLAAVEARRIDDRYNTLSKVVYSPCAVCPENPTPLWRIRARRVIHDEEERIIHYENAVFEVFGIPVAWLPYFRHADSTVERASGLLIPDFLSSSTFGYGLKVPYYLVIDPHSDLTFRPFITTNDGLILELEYRRLFENGGLSFGGSMTWNDYEGEEKIHGNVDTEGLFDIGYGIDAGWDIEFVSDDAYLRRYEYDYVDRLTSEVFVERYREDSFFDLAGVYFQSLRENEPAGQIPLAVPLLDARMEVADPLLGGELGFFTSGYLLNRNNGPDTGRFSIGADWEREEILPFGLALTGFAQVRGDIFSSIGDPDVPETPTSRIVGLGGVELRYPLIWDPADGADHVLEPVLQAIVAPYGQNEDFPDEDSLVNEFDELSVIDRDHFSGLDRVEEGPRLNVLLRYDRISDEGLSFDAAIGRSFRFVEQDAFSEGSGLRDQESDFVAAWQASYDPYVVVRHRMRFDDDATVTRNEVFSALNLSPVELSASYIFLEADPEIGAPLDREEVIASAGLQIDRNWSLSGFMQRDLQIKEFVQLGGQVTWENECAAIDVYLRRRFTDTVDAPASTSVGVNVRLLTLGTTEIDAQEQDEGLLPGRFGCG